MRVRAARAAGSRAAQVTVGAKEVAETAGERRVPAARVGEVMVVAETAAVAMGKRSGSTHGSPRD